MGTLGEQFRHIGNIQFCYIDALTSIKVDFSRRPEKKMPKISRKKLLEMFVENDSRLLNVLDNLNSKTALTIGIDWTDTHQRFQNLTVAEHLDWLADHEVLHGGELIVYC